jgi:predicted homoserine dehydrogenase-like protein
MLTYYKIPSSDGRYLFHRPFHLCHLETPTAVLRVARSRRPLPDGPMTRRLDVFAHAKGELRRGDEIGEAVGSDRVLGVVREAVGGDRDDMVPQCLLQAAVERFGPVAVRREVADGEPIRFGDLDLPAPDAEALTAALLDEAERAVSAFA